MKKTVLFLIILALVFQGPVYAGRGNVRQLFNSTEVFDTDVSTSSAFPVPSAGYFGVWYQATSSAGAPDLLIEYEMSYDSTAGNFIEPESAVDIETNLVAETAKVKSINPPPMKYMRIKATGNASNAADTILTLYVFIQE